MPVDIEAYRGRVKKSKVNRDFFGQNGFVNENMLTIFA